MLTLVVGLVLFFAIHLVPTQTELRAGLVSRFGEGAYKGIFTLVSFAGLVLIVLGYGKLQVMPGKNPELWFPPLWLRHVALALMLPSMILLVAAYVPSRIRDWVRHPMLASVKLWALAHLLANGDLASVVLFGSFLAWAVFDRISVKRRAALGPLGTRTGGPIVNDILVVVVGSGLYLLLLKWAHKLLIGVSPVG
jgi:uncharacterized membrane protein